MTAAQPAGALTKASEISIVLLAINGDDAAYSELVRRRQGAVRNLLRRLARDSSLADDLAQQTFVQGWQSIRSLKAPGAFGGWIRKLAVNFWLQHAQLPRDVRVCIVLAYSEGLSHGEISQATGIPLGTVKSHINRGSVRLRELLKPYGDTHER